MSGRHHPDQDLSPNDFCDYGRYLGNEPIDNAVTSQGPRAPVVYIGGLSGSSAGLTGSTRVGAYHRTNKLLFHVGHSFYKLLGGFFHVICVFYIYYLRV